MATLRLPVMMIGYLLWSRAAWADDRIAGHRVDRAVDGAIVVGAIGAAGALSLIPVELPDRLWRRELFGDLDARVHDQFSPAAAKVSDGFLALSVAAPLAYLSGRTTEDADGDRWLVYGEALAINAAVFQGVKRLIQRPRPYAYHRSPEMEAYVIEQGSDAYQSFYSAHAATAFCAATAGAYLASTRTPDRWARRAAWSSGFAVAAAAANLRVRAGKHFYSDIVLGALVGTAIGYAVPALHATDGAHAPSGGELAAATVGIVGGTLVSQLLPFGRGRPRIAATDDVTPHWAHKHRVRRALHRAQLQLAPVAMTEGAGLGLSGRL